MRDLETGCYFEPPRDGTQGGQDEDDSAAGLDLPTAVLQRHGARVLSPADAAVVPGWPMPRSTVYRARTLLVPGDILRQEPVIGAINSALARIGLMLVPPRPVSPAADQERADGQLLPRSVVLGPALPTDHRPASPVVVDAWTALQTLRAAATSREDLLLDEGAVSRISLEHLLAGSALNGPITHGGGLTGSPITHGGGITGPGSTDSYMYSSGDARAPVELYIDAPVRRPLEDCVDLYGRRPVVAVLDTGVRRHPWLDVLTDQSAAGGYTTIPDGFVAVDPVMQDVIHAQGELALSAGDQPRQLIRYPWDTPVTADPLIGELDTDTGHGTFIAGIVRQVVPDAQVLAVRIMHSDGVVYEGDLICALSLLADRVAAAEQGDLAAMVDVVSLSLGYFSESAADEVYTSGLWSVIDTLLQMGVAVVAAAGNNATSRKFYPAAFAERATGAQYPPLISVGALNPNGSKALFSDGGSWIRAWAAGAAVVSTFPNDVNGSLDPEISMPAHPANLVPAGLSLPAERAALDPDDFSSGFAIWSGTSFSAPQLAAQIVRKLLDGAEANPALRLDQTGAAAAAGRVIGALESLGWKS